jgi:hypothetical protein
MGASPILAFNRFPFGGMPAGRLFSFFQQVLREDRFGGATSLSFPANRPSEIEAFWKKHDEIGATVGIIE